MQTDEIVLKRCLRVLYLDWKIKEKRVTLGLAGASKTSKPTAFDTLPPTRPYFLIVPLPMSLCELFSFKPP